MLAGPFGRSIAQTSDADAARQSSLDGGLHEFRREECERDRHIDLSNAAFFARSDLIDTDDRASNDLIKPATTARDRCNKCGAGFGADRSTILGRHGSWHDDFASPFHWRLLPWNAQNKLIIVHRVGRIDGCLCLELDHQLVRPNVDADDVVADKIAAITFCGISQMLADSRCNESLELGRGHPAHGAGTPRLSVQEG